MLKDRGFYDKFRNDSASGFPNDYELHADGTVIIDRASGLMWQQSGCGDSRMYLEANAYVTKLNKNQFAGYNDWRLPTLEEAMSLVEPEAMSIVGPGEVYDDLYIDTIFDSNQSRIWTSDLSDDSSAWVVNFINGDLHQRPHLPRPHHLCSSSSLRTIIDYLVI